MTDDDTHRRTVGLTRRTVLGTAGLSALGGALGLGASGSGTAQEGSSTSDPREPGWRPASESPAGIEASLETTTVVEDLTIPWDVAIAGDDAFLSERPGRVYRLDTAALVDGEGIEPSELEVVVDESVLPDLSAPGEGGALGIAVHPDYPAVRELFLYYTVDVGEIQNRIVKYDLDAGESTTLVDAIPGAEIHNGGRLEIGPEGYLWATTADAQEEYDPDRVTITQDPGSLAGAVLRMDVEGNPHPHNPDLGPDADPRVFTYGHRNPQGLAFTPNGRPIATEHGPSARDEVSVLCAGGNYGWGIARGGPDDPDWEFYGDHDEFAPPLINTGRETASFNDTWDPIDTWAPSGASFYTADAIPELRNRMLVAGLRGQAIYAISLYPPGADVPDYPEGTRYDEPWFDDRFEVVVHELFYQEYGRLRHVHQGPNGELIVLTGNDQDWTPPGYPTERDDRVLRIEPA